MLKKLFFIFLFYLYFLPQSETFRICGNYCGPGWCNGRELEEAMCDTTVKPDDSVLVADRCCQMHDHCCGHGNRSTCNALLANCILGGGLESDTGGGLESDTGGGLESDTGGGLESDTGGGLESDTGGITDISWYDWVLRNVGNTFICGMKNNSVNTIAYFFESMDVIEFFLSRGTRGMCCGTVC
jgi:hypothetical protein